MPGSGRYEIRLAPSAAKHFRKLPARDAKRVRGALDRLARSTPASGAWGNKSLKQIKGRRDRFYRLRVGDLRIMFDVLEAEHVVLVLGIVCRGDLDRWLKGR